MLYGIKKVCYTLFSARVCRIAGYALVLLLPALFMLLGCSKSSTVLSGLITNEYTGEPVPVANIHIGDVELQTDSNGWYSTLEWKPKDKIKVSAAGYEPMSISLDSQEHLVETTEPTVTLNMQLRPNTLEGIIMHEYTGNPIEGVQIVATLPDDTNMQTTTDAQGKYVLDGLTQQFRLAVQAEDYKPVQLDLNRTTTYDVMLLPDILMGSVTDQASNLPIEGAIVRIGTVTTTTGLDGNFFIRGIPDFAHVVEITASGYATYTHEMEPTTRIDAALRRDRIEATLVDEESGEPVSFATIIATRTLTDSAVTSVRIDNSPDGRFVLRNLPELGYLHVLAPGYRKAVLDLYDQSNLSQIVLEPFDARAIYAKTSTVAYQPDLFEEFLDVIDDTELNAIVIDLKSDNMADLGLIYYESQVPIIQELGTSQDLMDIRSILEETRRRNIYTIARIHIFSHDNLLAETRPDWAAQNTKGCVPNENRRCNGDVFYADWDVAWLDPWNRNVWNYNIQLGMEAAQLGFDEVQFDYIRFPNDAKDIEFMKLSKPIDYQNNPQPMYENIATFMEKAHEAINSVGAFFSVDVFGYASWQPQPMIGQNMELMGDHADFICPMVYPSHYYQHELGFENASAYPYEIVFESLKRGQDMIDSKRAKQRPWLQDFTLIWVPDHLIVRYGPEEVRAQIQATEDFPEASGWALWSADNEYTYSALNPAN